MNIGVQKEIRNAAHFAHTLSRLAVDYERMAREMPWKRDKFLKEADDARGSGWQWLDHARDLRERYA